MPVGASRRFKSHRPETGRKLRRKGGVEKHRLRPSQSLDQLAKQRDVVLSAEEEHRLTVIRQQLEIVVSIALSPTLPRIGRCAESDVVVRRQETCWDQAPAGGDNVDLIHTEPVNQAPV